MSTNRRVCLGLSISHVVIGLVTVVVLLLELEKIKLDILDLTAGKTQDQIIRNAHSLISRIGMISFLRFYLNRPWNTDWWTYSEMFSLEYLISRIILVIILMLLYGLYSIFIGLFGNSIFFWQPISAPKILTTYIILLSINIGSSGKFIRMLTV